jgi:hypothetical protein
MATDEDAVPYAYRSGTNHPLHDLIRTERLGGETMSARRLKELGLVRTLSEVDRTSEDIRSDVESICDHMSLPEIVKAEATSLAFSLPAIHGSAVRERAIFCVYLAGKKHDCIRADISSISTYLSAFDQRWTRGRILRAVALLQSKVSDDFVRRVGPVTATSVETYIDHIFRSLSSALPRTQAGLQLAYKGAMVYLEKIKQETPERVSGRSPRALAAYLAHLAVRDVEWDALGISTRDIVWPKEIMRCSDVSKKSVTGQRYVQS